MLNIVGRARWRLLYPSINSICSAENRKGEGLFLGFLLANNNAYRNINNIFQTLIFNGAQSRQCNIIHSSDSLEILLIYNKSQMLNSLNIKFLRRLINTMRNLLKESIQVSTSSLPFIFIDETQKVSWSSILLNLLQH